jgi:site-specific DNA-methyltransferase (adenine-specific)
VTVEHYLLDPRCVLLRGEALEALRALPDCSVDALVTDPPSGISFMHKGWDSDKGGRVAWVAWLAEILRECLRVLKPGAHALVWALPRTSHWTATAVEDAGFEVRDIITHLYGSGFPKSLDISKAIDASDAVQERRRRALAFTAWMRSTGITAAQICTLTGTDMGCHLTTHPTQPFIATADMFDLLRPHLPAVPPEIEALVRERTVESENLKARAVVVVKTCVDASVRRPGFAGEAFGEDGTSTREVEITAAHSPEAAQWAGFGTALKPASEHWILARKPLEGTYAENVLRWGVGALNVDGCRIGNRERTEYGLAKSTRSQGVAYGAPSESADFDASKGRWPANLVLSHDERCVLVGEEEEEVPVLTPTGDADSRTLAFGARTVTGTQRVSRDVYACVPGCPVRMLDEQSTPKMHGAGKKKAASEARGSANAVTYKHGGGGARHGDVGGASRFFATFSPDASRFHYCAKPARSEKDAGLEHLPTRTGGEATGREDGSAGLNSPRAGGGRGGGVKCHHPTVKAVALMRWLIRLVTPPGGLVLDPFAGSGTTGVAALAEGMAFLGVERDLDDATGGPLGYAEVAAGRLRHALANTGPSPSVQGDVEPTT